MATYTLRNMNKNKMIGNRLKTLLKQNVFKEVVTLNPHKKDLNYKIGQWYWSGYHQMAFKVIDKKLKDHNGIKRLKSVTVLWEDGKKTTHCTNLDSRYDFKLYK